MFMKWPCYQRAGWSWKPHENLKIPKLSKDTKYNRTWNIQTISPDTFSFLMIYNQE